MTDAKNKFLEQTKVIWQSHARLVLTDEDARQIIENAVGFFHILQKWEEHEKKKLS